MPPLTEIATLEQVRARLGVGPDPVLDPSLLAMKAAVERLTLRRTGYSLTGGETKETRARVRTGSTLYTERRPVIPRPGQARAVLVRARSHGSDQFHTILCDLLDARDGRLMLLSGELTPVFPPIAGQAPWNRWRQVIWPVVEFTYDVDPLGSDTNPLPDELVQAVIEWTAHWFVRGGGAAGLSSVSLGSVSESYSQTAPAVPAALGGLLAGHTREQAVMAW